MATTVPPPEATPTPEQQRMAAQYRIIAKINEKGKTGPCPICSHNTWGVGAYVALSVSGSPVSVSLGGTIYPTVTVYCRTCGNTQFVNLLHLGFTQEELASLTQPLSNV